MLPVETRWNGDLAPNALQWWYLALHCDDGRFLRGRLWTRTRRCGTELDLYPPQGEPLHLAEAWAAEAFHGERERLLVMVEGSRLSWEDGALHLAVRVGGHHLSGRGRPVVAWDRPVIRDRRGFTWTVPVLRGTFAGELDGEAVTGTLFVDHVRVEARPGLDWLRNYRGWHWGLAWTPGASLLFLEVDFRRDPVRHAFLAEEGPVRRCDAFPVQPGLVSEVALGRRRHAVVGLRTWRIRHRVVESRAAEALLNRLPGMEKTHGPGTLDTPEGPGTLWFEALRLA